MDHFTKYVVAAHLPDCSAISVTQAIMSGCVLKFGPMIQLVSDNASYFKGEVISELGRLLRISRCYTAPYHHERNGVCKRVLRLSIRCYALISMKINSIGTRSMFASPWLPDEKQQALSDAEAATVDITGRTYSTTVPDTIPPSTSTTTNLPIHSYNTRFRSRRTSA
ncbi:hypothetical protein OESDEN_04282 [Oesophagostomum dentatum]|uniref:Integrase catalytic domain-containing protein n=1 Tax=Oesophagostomum dentatum TaxID=61180 RepID=A0A0B1TK32_OESDE|nr:hypothetical protein OESDEN_04282 [Oesophagostomum dentatum]